MLDLYPNSRLKENIQKIRNLKSNSKPADQYTFIKTVENAVSRTLVKEVIEEGFFSFQNQIQ